MLYGVRFAYMMREARADEWNHKVGGTLVGVKRCLRILNLAKNVRQHRQFEVAFVNHGSQNVQKVDLERVGRAPSCPIVDVSKLQALVIVRRRGGKGNIVDNDVWEVHELLLHRIRLQVETVMLLRVARIDGFKLDKKRKCSSSKNFSSRFLKV